jgi:spermidine/putrescine-binding protein
MPGIAAYLNNPLSDPKPTLAKLASIKNLSLYLSSADMEARMTSGDIWVSLWIDGRANGLKLKGVDVAFAPLGIPNGKGGVYDYIAPLGMLVIANPEKKAISEAWINTMLSTSVATQVSLRSTYAPSNLEAEKAVKADPKVGPLVAGDLSNQFTIDAASWQKVQNKWIDAWGEVMRH